MKLHDIITQQSNYTLDSGYKVAIDTRLPTVTISSANDTIFTQGDDAECSIAELGRLYNKVDMDKDTIALALAMPYIDSL